MSDITFIAISRSHFERIVDGCSERRIDPDDARDFAAEYLDEHDLDTNASGIVYHGPESDEVFFFGSSATPNMFSARASQADDFYGMFDEGDETIIYSAVEDGIAFTLEAAMEGEVEELDDDFDFERIEVYHGDEDVVLTNFDWFEPPPKDVEHYKQLLTTIYTAYLEASES